MLEINKFYDAQRGNESVFLGFVVRADTDKYGINTYVLLNSGGFITISDWDYTRLMVVGVTFRKWE